jgi:uncharacterized protein (TIGR00645 family)
MTSLRPLIRDVMLVRVEHCRGRDLMERFIEQLILTSRWLLVPLYMLLSLLLIAFGVRAAVESVHIFGHLLDVSETDLTLAALSLIDMVLIANLIVMVALSSYETFVSTIDVTPDREKPSWLGKYDPGTIKLKLAASLVGISAIHLLRAYLNRDEFDSQRLFTLTAVHLAFVVSALILAWVDKIAFAEHRESHQA